MADNDFRSDRGRDSLAELARLIGQTAPEQACEPDEHRLDELADDEPCTAEDYYEDGAPRARQRSSVVLVMAILALAVVGTAGAFGYRAMFGGSVLPTLPSIVKASNEPNKIAPASTESQAKNGANASQAGATIGSTENLFSREERPVTIEPPKPAPRVMFPIPIATGQGWPPGMGTQDALAPPDAARNQAMPSGVAAAANSPHAAATAAPSTAPAAVASAPQVSSEPKKIETVRNRAGQSGVADVRAESTRAHTALANANSAAAVARSRGGYAVQVTSERSESKAQAAFRALQAKFPNQLTGRQPIIRRTDLGAKGTYYRALIGPFASAEKAAELCSGLKAAGGNCIVQRN